eukprot:scaffold1239_cov175-Pinguiococcus_pyrenoidosus.AAC.48
MKPRVFGTSSTFRSASASSNCTGVKKPARRASYCSKWLSTLIVCARLRAKATEYRILAGLPAIPLPSFGVGKVRVCVGKAPASPDVSCAGVEAGRTPRSRHARPLEVPALPPGTWLHHG